MLQKTYTASPTTATPMKLPGIKWICTVMHFSGHIHDTLYLQESNWAVCWASHSLSSFHHTSLLAPSCSFSQRLLPDCVSPPQHTLFCRLMMLSQPLHSCLPRTGRAKTVAWTLSCWQSTWKGLMEMTRFSGQCPCTINAESRKHQDPSHSVAPGLSVGKGRFFSRLSLPKRKSPHCCANDGNCVTASLFLSTAANHPKPF